MSVESLTGARSLHHMAVRKAVIEAEKADPRGPIIPRDSVALLVKNGIDPNTIPENVHKLINEDTTEISQQRLVSYPEAVRQLNLSGAVKSSNPAKQMQAVILVPRLLSEDGGAFVLNEAQKHSESSVKAYALELASQFSNKNLASHVFDSAAKSRDEVAQMKAITLANATFPGDGFDIGRRQQVFRLAEMYGSPEVQQEARAYELADGDNPGEATPRVRPATPNPLGDEE
jgi:hypothetical protein